MDRGMYGDGERDRERDMYRDMERDKDKDGNRNMWTDFREG